MPLENPGPQQSDIRNTWVQTVNLSTQIENLSAGWETTTLLSLYHCAPEHPTKCSSEATERKKKHVLNHCVIKTRVVERIILGTQAETTQI